MNNNQFVNNNFVDATNFMGEITDAVNNGLIGSVNFILKGGTYTESGFTYAQSADVKLDKWQQKNGVTQFDSGAMNLQNLTATQGRMNLSNMNVTIEHDLDIHKKSQITFNNTNVKSNNANVVGALNATNHSKIVIDQANVSGTADLQQSTMEATKLQVERSGQVNANAQSTLVAETANVAGTLNARQNSEVIITEIGKVSGTMSIDKSTMQAAQLQVEELGQVNANDKSILMAGKANVAGTLNAKQESTVIIAQEGTVSGTTILDKSQMGVAKLHVEKTWQVEVNADSILHTGEANVQGQLNVNNNSTFRVDQNAAVSGEVNVNQSQMLVKDKLDLSQSASLTLKQNSYLEAGVTRNEGIVKSEDSHIKVKQYQSTETSTTQLHSSDPAKSTTFITESDIKMQGKVDTKNAFVQSGTSVNLGEKTKIAMDTTCIEANNIQISSQIIVQGNNSFIAREYLATETNNNITGSGSVSFKAPKASLNGAFSASDAIVDIEHLDANVLDLVYGTKTYQNFQPKGLLSVTTPDSIRVNEALTRECKLELTARDISVNATVNMMKGMYLESTQGNVNINADIRTREITHIKSAAHILNHNAQVISDQALYLETLNGDLNNTGGVFQGRTYLQGKIKGNVYNTAIETVHQGKYDKIKQYKQAQLIGGKRDEDDIGLFMQVVGRFVNDSIVQSQGHNVIYAKKGYEGKSHTHNYISEKHKDHGWFSGSDKEVRTTDIVTSKMLSTDGRNIIKVEEGGIKSDAASFISKDGTDLFARDNIDLLGVKTTQKVNENSYSWFGISNSHKKESHEAITPTLIFDLGTSNIHSYKGDINALDARIVGPGHFYTKANNIRMSSGIEKHSVKSHTQSLSIDVFGLSAIRAIASGKDFVSPLVQQDPTAARLNTLVNQSGNYAELGVNTWNTALSAYNTYQTFNAARQANALGGALLQRFNLGNSSGFNPTVSLNFTDTQSNLNYQTSGPSGVFRGSWDVDADNQFIIENCPVDIKDNMSVKAKVFNLKTNPLQSNFSSQSVTGSVGVTIKGDVLTVGMGYQQQEGAQSVYDTQLLRVGKNLDLKDVKSWKMDQAQCDVGSITGNVDELIMTSRLNKQSSSGFSIHAATSGFMGGYYSNDSSETLSQQSAIMIRSSQGSNLAVGRAELKGGEIHMQKYNDIKIGEMTTETIAERATGNHYGIFGNLMDVLPKQKQSELTVAGRLPKLLPLMNIQLGDRSYLALNNSGISSLDRDSDPKEQLLWNVNNQRTGKTIVTNHNMTLHVDVPLIVYPHSKIRERVLLPVLNKTARKTNELLNREIAKPNETLISRPVVDNNNDEKSNKGSSKPVIKNNKDGVVLPGNTSAKIISSLISSKSEAESLKPISSTGSAQPASTAVLDHSEKSAEEAAILVQEKDQSDKTKYKYSYPKMKTADARVGTKNNKNGDQQLFDIDNGQFINGEGMEKKIKEKNEKRHGVSKEFKLSVKKEFIKPKENIFWQAEDENSLIRPTLVSDSGRGFFAAEYEPAKNQLKIKLEGGIDLRVNLIEQVQNIGTLGQTHFAVDAGSVHALMRLSASNERGMNLEACAEGGIMGPSVNTTYKSTEICLFGLSVSCDAAVRAGLGAKGALGGGMTLEKTQFRITPYAKVGGYFGVGAETEVKINLGIDTEINKRMADNYKELAEIPLNKRLLDGAQECIQEIENEQPTTLWGKLWKQYKLDCYREVIAEKIEGMGEIAAVGGMFAVRKAKAETASQEKHEISQHDIPSLSAPKVQ